MALSDAYMLALRNYLQDRYEIEPPPLATIGTLKIGSHQADPESRPAVITLHTNDPFTDTSIHIEQIADQKSQGGGTGHRLWGGYTEMGDDGKGTMYWYNWWLRVEYYMTRSGFQQDRARETNDDLLRWLRHHIISATPRVLAVPADEDAVLLQTKIVALNTREHGGTQTSYIWSSLIKIRGLVFGD